MDLNPIEIRKNIVYLLQTPHLFGNMVMDNMEFPFQVRNKRADVEKIESCFQHFQMSTDYLKRDISKLSGGEKQRIALIRSLLFKPRILLLDEVTSALDEENTRLVENIISEIHGEGTTILWVTHDLKQSRKFANRLLTFHQGEIVSKEVLRK